MSEADKNLLVVGDWYVDAHWVVAPHESQTASRPGEMQSLAIHGLDSTVRALCGAGQVASILTAAAGGGVYEKVYGLGSWAKDDDGFIQALVGGSNEHDNPLRLRSAIKEVIFTQPSDRRVFNLYDSAETGTSRVIRLYRKSSASQYRLVDRIDFETPPRTPTYNLNTLFPTDLSIGHILVKDHGHGIVDGPLVATLKDRFTGAKWYVSTKRWNAEWLKSLEGEEVRLILFQQEAAAKAATGWPISSHVGNWFVEERVPTRKALTAIDEVFDTFAGKKDGKSPVIIALPSRDSLIARIPADKASLGFVYRAPIEKAHESFVPRASALFASIFHADIILGGKTDWHRAILRALEFTAIWVQEEATRITDRNWVRNGASLHHSNTNLRRPIIRLAMTTTKARDVRISKVAPRKESLFNWNHVSEEYNQAFSGWSLKPERIGFGIVKRPTGLYLELWRAMSEATGVISIVRAKRNMLDQLSGELSDFVRGGRRHHKSFMIVDDPGGGKSTLVRSLALSQGMRVLQVNITELTRRIDLLAFFDTVVTSQAQDPEAPILVFVDEINALLEGHTVYSSFLAPLEDGHYNRDGKSFTISPCVWVFAGTEDLAHGTRKIVPPGAEAGFRWKQLEQELDRYVGSQGGIGTDKRTSGMLAALRSHLFGTAESTTGAKQTEEEALAERRRFDRAQKKSDFLSRLTLPPLALNEPFAAVERLHQKFGDLYLQMRGCLEALSSDTVGMLRIISEVAKMSSAKDDDSKRIATRLIGQRLLRQGEALERIYVGAHLITRMHPDVEKISLRVLKAFAYLPDSFSFRDLRHDLERLTNVQRGEVRWDNLPARFHSYNGQVRLDSDRSLTSRFGQRILLSTLCPTADDGEMVNILGALSPGDEYWTGQSRF